MMYTSSENAASASATSTITIRCGSPGFAAERVMPISFTCIICYDDFNFSDRAPVVLPCGHTYVCLTCTKQLKRCMECREPLFVPVPTPSGQCDSAKENTSMRQHLNRQSSAPLSLREMRNMRRAAATTFVSPQTMNNQNQGKQDMMALPVPKNLVLLEMMEAYGLRQHQEEEERQVEQQAAAQSTSEDRLRAPDLELNKAQNGNDMPQQQPLLDHEGDDDEGHPEENSVSLRPSVEPPAYVPQVRRVYDAEQDCGCASWQASEAMSHMMDEDDDDDNNTNDISGSASSVVVDSTVLISSPLRRDGLSHLPEEDVEIVSLSRDYSRDEDESVSSATVRSQHTNASSSISMLTRSPCSPSFVNFRTGLSGHHGLTSNLPKKRMMSSSSARVHF